MIGTLSISTTRGIIGIKTTRAAIQVQSNRPQLQIESKPARFKANTNQPRIKIDQTKAFASSGNAPILELSKQNASKAVSLSLEGIGRMVDEGNYIGDIGIEGNRVATIAGQSGSFEYEVNGVAMPAVGPEFSFTPEYANLEWEPYQLSINFQTFQPQFTVTPHSVEVFMQQWPDITISYTPSTPYFPLGNYVDKII